MHVKRGHYDLLGPNGEIILPILWEFLIRPGWGITMHMWPLPAEHDPVAGSISDGGSNPDLSLYLPPDSSWELVLLEPIKLKDIIGRKFAFPYFIVKTWKVS